MALSTKVSKWTQDKAGDDSTWKAYDANGNQIKNSWVQDSKGWLYLDKNGVWDKTSGNAFKDNSGKYGVVGDNGYWSSAYQPTKSLNQYQDDATRLVEPTYQKKRTNLINSLAQGTQAYQSQFNDTRNIYADRINSQKINTEKEKSQFANNMTSRGLGHSTIVGTGIAGIGDQGSRLVNSIDIEKAQKLDDILNSIAQLKVNTQNQLNDLDAAKGDDIYSKALEMYMNDNSLANEQAQTAISQQNADTNRLQAEGQNAYYTALANKSGGGGGSGYSGYSGDSGGGYTGNTKQPASGSSGTLSQGMSGDSVAKLQSLLGITADGVFGAGTKAAVMAFQKAHGLTPDGIVGQATLAALNNAGSEGGSKKKPQVDAVSGYAQDTNGGFFPSLQISNSQKQRLTENPNSGGIKLPNWLTSLVNKTTTPITPLYKKLL